MTTVNELMTRVDRLLTYKAQVEKQQLKEPLDAQSRAAIETGKGLLNGVLVIKDRSLTGPIFFTDLLGFGMGVDIPNVYSNVTINEGDPTEKVIPTSRYYLYATVPLTRFTIDTSTDVFSYSGHPQLSNGDRIAVVGNGDLPTGLSEAFPYYVVNRAAKTFQLSESEGGSPIDILVDNGALEYYFGKI